MFYGAGGALGFDTLAAKTVLDIMVYEDIKRRSDKIVYVSREYTPDCMHRRNRHLVDHSGTCICYLTRSTGGTAYTVDYARRKGLRIINLAEECHI